MAGQGSDKLDDKLIDPWPALSVSGGWMQGSYWWWHLANMDYHLQLKILTYLVISESNFLCEKVGLLRFVLYFPHEVSILFHYKTFFERVVFETN